MDQKMKGGRGQCINIPGFLPVGIFLCPMKPQHLPSASLLWLQLQLQLHSLQVLGPPRPPAPDTSDPAMLRDPQDCRHKGASITFSWLSHYYHKIQWLKQQKFIPSQFQRPKSEIKVPAGSHSRGCMGKSIFCLFELWVAVHIPWLMASSLQSCLASIFTFPLLGLPLSLSYKNTGEGI